MWVEDSGVEVKPYMKVVFQVLMTGRRVEPLTDVVMGQVNILIIQLGLKFRQHPSRNLQMAEGIEKRGGGEKLQLEVSVIFG